jgi:hypothetical protein
VVLVAALVQNQGKQGVLVARRLAQFQGVQTGEPTRRWRPARGRGRGRSPPQGGSGSRVRAFLTGGTGRRWTSRRHLAPLANSSPPSSAGLFHHRAVMNGI